MKTKYRTLAHHLHHNFMGAIGIAATSLGLALAITQSANAGTFFWDTNGTAAGSGAATGTWDTSSANCDASHSASPWVPCGVPPVTRRRVASDGSDEFWAVGESLL